MNIKVDDWHETAFMEWASKMYRAWLYRGMEPLEEALAAAIEKSEQTEGENE